jgi:hypothetical protein
MPFLSRTKTAHIPLFVFRKRFLLVLLFVCRRVFPKSPLKRGTVPLFFVGKGDFSKTLSLYEGRTMHFFLCQKEKSSKKEVGKPAV